MSVQSNKMKAVFTIVEGKERTFWRQVGVAFVNRDGSLNLHLDALPTNGKLQVRDAKREAAESHS